MKSKKQVIDNNERFDEFPDKLTGLLEKLAPERKERPKLDASNEDDMDEAYYEKLKNKRRARYEALMEKYKD